jgi:hypothetical protein
MGRRKSRKWGKVLAWIAFLAAVAAMVAIAYLIHSERPREARRADFPARKPPQKSLAVDKTPERGKHVRAEPARTDPARTRPAPEMSASPSPRRVVIIIDDIGHDLAPLQRLLAIEAPLTFAVLPDGAHSERAARLIHEKGREVLLHLPLEPRPGKGANPGALVLRTDMNDQEIRAQLAREIRTVPHARGANGHMGSRFTEDPDKMAVVLRALRERGLFFIDSRTTPQSRAREAAERTGIPFAERSAFIDDSTAETDMLNRIRRITADDSRQPTVLIGHPYPDTIRSLSRVVPLLAGQGIQIVSASQAVGPVVPGKRTSP